jgi:hypothetical protein
MISYMLRTFDRNDTNQSSHETSRVIHSLFYACRENKIWSAKVAEIIEENSWPTPGSKMFRYSLVGTGF